MLSFSASIAIGLFTNKNPQLYGLQAIPWGGLMKTSSLPLPKDLPTSDMLDLKDFEIMTRTRTTLNCATNAEEAP